MSSPSSSTATTSPSPSSAPQGNASPSKGYATMPFVKHLEELRKRLIYCIAALIATTGLTFVYANPIILALKKLTPASTTFVQLSPGEVFLSSFKLSMFAGVGLALPIILYHIIRFVSPGLNPKERRYIIPLLTLGLFLFCGGVLFGYAVILPLMLTFLLDYGQTVAQNQLSIASFLNFCTGFLFASGLIFQLPLFLLFASLINLVTSAKLIRQWKWAIIASFALGAVITPSADPFSQTVMAGSLFGLYGFSIGLIKLFGR